MRTTRVLGACLLAVAAASPSVMAAISAGERQSLVDIYTSTNGASWTNHTGWNGAAGTECTWFGVTCDGATTTVQQISLYENNLAGPLPTSLGGLTNLQYLDLDGNELTGSIPTAIGSLTKLQHLDLYGNQLTGSIPSQIGNLTALTYLDLSGNQLTGSIPTTIVGLTNLVDLYLGPNQLTGSIPTVIGSLTKLETLALGPNQLTGSIPAQLGNLTNLVELYLDNNQLTGSIPSALGTLANLTDLDLQVNQLTGSIPTALGSLTKLEHLELFSNALTGSIPTVLGSLTALKALDLSGNQLSGSIPSELGNLTNVTYLSLNHNQLTGTIPAALGSMAKLQYLELYGNQLASPIPSQLGNLSTLLDLDLAVNRFTGSIPSWVGSLTNLRNLYLEGNAFSGPIPTSLESLTYLVAGASDLRHNALYSTDATLTAFLNGKQQGGDWQSTQTVAPTGVATGTTTGSSVALSWTPITYTGDTGGYQPYYSTTSGGPYTAGTITANKSTSSTVVNGLSSGTTYYFVVRTVSNPNGFNDNTVTSDPSAEVHAATSGTPAPLAITTASPLPDGTVGVAYSLQFTATGGTGGNVWSLASGSLDFLSLSADGLLSGTPAASGDFSPTIQVEDHTGGLTQKAFALHVNAGTSYAYTTWVPVASHNGGKNHSQWRSDLGLLNTGAVRANVEIKFYGGGGVVSDITFVPAGTQSILTDVVGQVGGSNSGALEILSDQPLKITARTYNQVASDVACYPGGTQGQDYPALATSDGLSATQSAYLGGLVENQALYHTNIGVVNTGDEVATVLVELFAGTGNKLTDYPVTLSPGDWKQETQPFLNKAGNSNIDRGYAKVTVNSGSGVFAFASVVDNTTNDPTTIVMQPSLAPGAQFTQQGSKLAGAGGASVAISADGNTAIVGDPYDSSSTGAAWVYTRSAGVWSQQGGKLVGTGAVGAAGQGISVALSADGNTAIVGGISDNGGKGAAWVFKRSAGAWSQQGSKLVGTGAVGAASQGISVALSADGNTAIVGGYEDNSEVGAVWVFTRSAGAWSQQGNKLVGTGGLATSAQGVSVALSADGNTTILGAYRDNGDVGGAWVFTRSGTTWSQQGSKLVGTGGVGSAERGLSVAISADGNTAIVGAPGDNSYAGAAWVFTRSGTTWSQQGSKLIGTGAAGAAYQGHSVALSGDGDTALIGGHRDNSDAGAVWVFTRSGTTWSQQGHKLVGTGATGKAQQGYSVAISADGTTALVGGFADDVYVGAAWVLSNSANATWVPVASHNGGKNHSQWRSDLGLLNTGAATANVQINFYGGSIVSSTTHVAGGTQAMLTDVVGQVGGSNSGALEIVSDQPLKITARTYNQVASDAPCYPGGTQGQDYPAVVPGDGLSATQSAYLGGLVENQALYHTNIGVVNTGDEVATVLVELFAGTGNKLTDYSVTLNPGDWKQETQPFLNKAGRSNIDRGYAKITVQSGSGVFAFASVVDNTTNDPTTVTAQP